MHWIPRLGWIPLVPILLLAADPPWKGKPIPQWDEQDSKQVLSDSPWVRYTTPEWVRDLSPDERRNGGDMEAGIGKGIGLAGIGVFGARRQAEAIARAHEKPQQAVVMVRWESALPIRAAERITGETSIPALDADHYAIAVYNIPTPKKWNLANELKGVAFIRRVRWKDLKPSRVVILRQDEEKATIVYLFPRSVEISKRDGWLVFAAQIGRLFVSQNFYAEDMQIRGELEL